MSSHQPKPTPQHHAIIIGGGIGGLATANLLAKSGYIVDLYEKRNQLGGRMGMLQDKGYRFDTGPSWYLMPAVFEHYYSLLNTSPKDELNLVKLKPAYKVFFEGRKEPVVIHGDLQKDMATFEHFEPGAGQALARYLRQADKTYHQALKYFLYTDFASPRPILKPRVIARSPTLLRHSFASLDDFVSKHFTRQELQQILEYPAVFLGGSPFNIPALYHLMSHLDFTDGVYYPQGGMYTVTESMIKLGEQLGVRYHLDTEVKSITTEQRLVTGITLANDQHVPANVVISNADLHFTQTKLLAKSLQDYPDSYWQKREAGPSALLMYLGIKGKLPQLNHHNLFFARTWRENFDAIFHEKKWPATASIYVCKPSQTDTSVAPKGYENVFVLVPLPAGMFPNKQALQKYAQVYIDQIAKQAGIADFKDRIVYQKLFGPHDFETEYHAWQGSALGLSHRLTQSALFRPAVKSKKVRNLYYVGANSRPGIGVPMCLIGAELVAHAITNDYPHRKIHHAA